MKLYGYNLQEHHDEISKQKNKSPAAAPAEEKKVDRSVSAAKLSVESNSKPALPKRDSAP